MRKNNKRSKVSKPKPKVKTIHNVKTKTKNVNRNRNRNKITRKAKGFFKHLVMNVEKFYSKRKHKQQEKRRKKFEKESENFTPPQILTKPDNIYGLKEPNKDQIVTIAKIKNLQKQRAKDIKSGRIKYTGDEPDPNKRNSIVVWKKEIN
tara:strand:- start:7007 stop:7453 length:447 start_codon:yes stop_codon:yes gene_type:complete